MPNEYVVYDTPFDVSRWELNIGICGSRELFDNQILESIKATVKRVIEEHRVPSHKVLIISGGAKGVDTLAKIVALKMGLDMLIVKPNYKENPTVAPLRRNDRIVELSDVLIAVPSDKSRGTWYTITRFKSCKPHNQLIILRYDKQPLRT